MALLENVFSWSKSRDEEFRECQRKYFYGRYASWGGWDQRASPEIRMAYVLKNLKNRWAWKGETVHHVIEHVLKSLRAGNPFPEEAALSYLTETMRRDWRSSKAKKYLENPKTHIGLFEHEYSKSVSDETWKKMHDGSVECLKNFYASDLYAELLQDDKKSWLVIEDLEEFGFEGARIYVKLDFARQKNGLVEIYDWKTGKNDSDASIQVGTYALYATQKWRVPLEAIRAYLVGLSGAPVSPKSQPLTETLMQNTKSAMRKSIGEMKSLLSDSARNVPKPAESFKFTENIRFCDSCNFYKICEKYQS